ncbi:LHFPL tetraspan subfamily member 7 protein [Pantherophis guttatus]|uniref:LHFPL tetraspan subfamily member 7 protein n=1 Tax=Pantherophis guttatus TaxID=94885 RepID=A0ABM3YZR4_PANGU|nr:LHFPL tetraspan subfamily member 7 protein [Pantherophis guttatus]
MPPRRKKKKKKQQRRVAATAGSGGQAAGALASGRPPPHAAALPRMFSGVGCFWLLLSSCLVAVCSFGFLSPAWIVRQRGGGGGGRRWERGGGGGSPAPGSVESFGGVGEVTFGLLWHCSEAPRHLEPCDALGGFGQIPSASWQTSAVLCVGGCALLAFSALLAVIVLFLPSGHCERRLCTLAGYIQTAAVFIMGFGLLVYPFGFGSLAVRTHCEDSSIYYAGSCQLGWGYMLAIVGVMLSVFLPFFAKYAPKDHPYPTPIPTIL